MTKSSDSFQLPSSPRAYHKGNVADDLRTAATRILATESRKDVTIRRLAKEVGVAPANFYNHFDSLDDLLLSIAASALSQAVDRATALWSRPGTKPELLVAAATDFIGVCLKNRQLMGLMMSQGAHDGQDSHREAGANSFREVVKFIYGERTEEASSELGCEKYGVAVGYIALTYGFAVTLAEGRFAIDVDDEAELSQFVRNGILPFLDGSAAAILSSSSEGRF